MILQKISKKLSIFLVFIMIFSSLAISPSANYSFADGSGGSSGESSGVSTTTGSATSVTTGGATEITTGSATSFWPQFRGNKENLGITDVKLPYESDQASLKWQKKLGSSMKATSHALIVDDKIIVVVGNNIYKYSKDGTELLKGTLLGSTGGYTDFLAYGEGMIFTHIGEGRIQALDFNTFKSKWISTIDSSYSTIAPINYHDGYIYTASGTTASDAGKYACIKVSDPDTSRIDEENSPVWVHQSSGGYYWSGAAVVNDNLVFAGDDKTLIVKKLKTGETVDSYGLNGQVRSSLVYDGKGNLFFGDKEGYVYSINIGTDGKLNKETVKTAKLSSQCTSTPVVYNGRLYVGAGQFSSGTISVFDANTLEEIYEAEVGAGGIQGSLLLSTGYSSEENDKFVNIIFTKNTNPSGIYSLEDFAGNTSAKNYEEIFIPDSSSQNYCLSTPVCDDDGTIYFTNDSGNFFAVAREKIEEPNTDYIKPTVTIDGVTGVTDSKEKVVRFEVNPEDNISAKENIEVSVMFSNDGSDPKKVYPRNGLYTITLGENNKLLVSLTDEAGNVNEYIYVMNAPVKVGDAYVVVEDNTLRPNNGEGLESPEATGTILPITSVEVYQGDTAARVVKRALDSKSISNTGLDVKSPYLSEVKGLRAFDGGPESAWMYMVNGYPPQINEGWGATMGDYIVEDHDFIQILYTCQGYGTDIGMGFGISKNNLISDVKMRSGWTNYSLDKEFKNDLKDYNLILKSSVKSIKMLLEQDKEKLAGITKIKSGDKEYKFWQDIPVEDGGKIVLSDSANEYNINVIYDDEKPTYEISGISDQMTSEEQNVKFTITVNDNLTSREDIILDVTFTDDEKTAKKVEAVDGQYSIILKEKNVLMVRATDQAGNYEYNSYTINYDYFNGLNPYPTKIVGYMPGPGQFRYETACDNPETIFEEDGVVSLGSFGGYVAAGFDYSIQNQEGTDFVINGNYRGPGFEEPGSVMVMVDKNRNGKADDIWYELAGDSYGAEDTVHNYSVTYKNPGPFDPETLENNNVSWEDSLGNTGAILCNKYHPHSWYPESNKWSDIDQDEYTLTGTKIISQTPGSGYVDVSKDEPFDISDAVDSEGKSVELKKIDFIKVYTSTQNASKWFGPASCEVSYIKVLPQNLNNLDQESVEVITSLIDKKTLTDSKFEFTASALSKIDGYEDLPVNLEYVKLNDAEITGVDGKYSVNLLEGNNKIVIAVLDGEDVISKEYNLIYSPYKEKTIKVRIESYDKTIMTETEVQIEEDDLNLSDYNISKKFKDAKPIHAIIKALEKNGFDVNDKDKFDFGGGSYISNLDGIKAASTGVTDAWMYYVNDGYANEAVDSLKVKDGDSIVVYFVEDYNTTLYSFFETEEDVVTGESFELVLKSSRYDWNSKATEISPVEGAKILVDNNPLLIDGNEVLTDKNGKATIKLDKTGTFSLSAEKRRETIIKDWSGNVLETKEINVISRPISKVNVSPYKEKTFKVRVESFNKTVMPETEIKVSVDDLNLSDYKISKKFKDAKPIHAIIKALEKNGFDVNDKDKFDFGGGSYISNLDGIKAFSTGATDGWMYYVNDSFANEAVDSLKVEDGDSIVVYFVEDYNTTEYSRFEESSKDSVRGQMFAVKLKSFKHDWITNKEVVSYVEGAKILIDGKPLLVNGKEVLTDKNGKADVIIDKTGKIFLSAEKRRETVVKDWMGNVLGTKEINVISRPIMEVNISYAESDNNSNDKPDGNTGGASSSGGSSGGGSTPSKPATPSKIEKPAADNKTEKLVDDIEKISSSEELSSSIDNILTSFDKYEEEKEVSEIAENLISKVAKVNSKLRSEEINKKLIEVTEKAIEKSAGIGLDLNADSVAKVDLEQLKESADKSNEEVDRFEKVLKENNISLDRQIKQSLILDVKTENDKELKLSIEKGSLGLLEEKGITSLHFKSITGNIEIPEKAFSKDEAEKDISFEMEKLESNDDKIIVRLNAYSGDDKVTSFNDHITITVPYSKNEDSNGQVVVYHQKEDGSLEAMGGIYDSVKKVVTFKTNHFSEFVVTEIEKTFTDLGSFSWAKEQISSMAAKGVINGKSEKTFDPSASITRAEFSALISRMLKLKGSNDKVVFDDVKDSDWYAEYVQNVYSNKLMNGISDSKFNPNGFITNQEIAVVIERILIENGFNPCENQNMCEFLDLSDADNWAKSAICTIDRESMCKGYENSTEFSPKESANRASVAVMLYNLYETIMKL